MTTTSTGERDYAHDARARANRAAKAYRLADAIDDLGHVPDVAERRTILHQLHLPRASDETWSMAIDISRSRS